MAQNDDAAEGRIKQSVYREFARYAGALAFVFVVGIVAWAVDEHIHQGQSPPKRDEVVEWRSQVLGWISAAMFRKFGHDLSTRSLTPDRSRSTGATNW